MSGSRVDSAWASARVHRAAQALSTLRALRAWRAWRAWRVWRALRRTGSSPPHPQPATAPPQVASWKDSELYGKFIGISTFFNPGRHQNKVDNFRKFHASVAAQGLQLLCVELVFGPATESPFQLNSTDCEILIQRRTGAGNTLWQKERLLNIALENLPNSVDKVMWLESILTMLAILTTLTTHTTLTALTALTTPTTPTTFTTLTTPTTLTTFTARTSLTTSTSTTPIRLSSLTTPTKLTEGDVARLRSYLPERRLGARDGRAA